MAEFQFQSGEIVKLKSGGPNMTVAGNGTRGVACNWFAGAKLEQGYFSDSQLLKVDEEAESSKAK